MSTNIKAVDPQKSVIARFAGKFGVDQGKVLSTLKNTCFKQKNGEVSDEQMMALLIVAEQHKLNPFTKEIYAFPDKQNGIVPVVGVDGWSRIINEKPTFDGMEFNESDNMIELEGAKKCPEWIECAIYDSKRNHPVKAKEYLDEVYRPPFEGKGTNGPYTLNGPWQTHTKRMLRHKAMIQCARIAYGFGGIYDQDEAERIIDAEVIDVGPINESSGHRWKPGEKQKVYDQMIEALTAGDGHAVKEIESEYSEDTEEYMKFWSIFNSAERSAIKEMTKDI